MTEMVATKLAGGYIKMRTLIGGLIFFGIGVLMYCLLAFQAKLEWILAAQYLLWPYTIPLLAIVLIVIGLVLPKFRSLALGLAAASLAVFLLPFGSDFVSNLTQSKPEARPLKIIAFNWRSDNPSFDPFYAWIAQQRPDIVSIEEFNAGVPGVKERLYPQFPYHTTYNSDVVMFSRFPITSEHILQTEDHSVVCAKILGPDGAVSIFAIHAPTLRTGEELSQRNAYLMAATNLLSHDEAGTAAIMGDFNATRWDPFLAKLVTVARLHEQPRFFPLLTRMSIRHKIATIGSPIDHVFASRNARLTNCSTGPALGSDHLPVICYLASGK